jgi:glycosyltransferase involved in cell wall biosynthesis
MVVIILPSLQSGGTEWQVYHLARSLSARHALHIWVYDRFHIDARLHQAFQALPGVSLSFGVVDGLRTLLARRPRLILSYAINYYLPEIALRLLTGAVLVTERRNLYHWLQHQARRRWQEAWRNWLTRAVVCNSQAVADAVRRIEPEVVDRLYVLYNSVEPFVSVTTARRDTIAAVGNIKSGKGVERVLRIFQALEAQATERGVRFAVYGRCDDASLLSEFDAAFVQRVYRGQMPKEQIFADCFCLVHLSQAEGFPNAVLEATACGVVPILSDIAPHRELFSACAVLTDSDAAALDAVRQALDWPGREQAAFERLSERCRATAAQFSADRRAQRYQDLFYACLH